MDREALAAKARIKHQRKHPAKPALGVVRRVQEAVVTAAVLVGGMATTTAQAVKSLVTPS